MNRRKLGRIDLTDDISDYIEKNNLGPDALAVNKEQLSAITRESTASIKSVLMDQSRIAGIGNIYSDEILYQAGIHPGTKANKLNDFALENLYQAMDHIFKIALGKKADSSKFPGNWIIYCRGKGKHCSKCGVISRV